MEYIVWPTVRPGDRRRCVAEAGGFAAIANVYPACDVSIVDKSD
jgi:hypothetical protein